MELRPGYKLTEVGVIPEEWDVKRLAELFEVTSSKRVFQSDWKSEGVPFYRARELVVLGDTGSVDNELFITQELYKTFTRSYGVPDTGDMLVTGVGTLGKVYVVSGDHEFYFKDGNIIWFKIGGRVSPEFLRQLYLTPLITKQISDNSAGTTVGTYTIINAKKTVIPFPPLPEQSAIATALENVDALLSGLDRLIAKKQGIKQAAMQQLLTGKKRLPDFQGEWEMKRVAELGEVVTGGTPRTDVKVFWGDGYPWITPTDITNHRDISLSERKLTQKGLGEIRALSANSVLVTCIASIGKNAVLRTIGGCNQQINAVIPNTNSSVDYLYYMFSASKQYLLANAGTTATSIVSKSEFKQLIFKVPAYTEQIAIAEVLSDMDSELIALEHRRDKTKLLKQAMMQELLTGRIRLV